MVSRKPEIDYCVGLLHALLDDISIANGTKNTTIDKKTIALRSEKEGFAFLSRTLPALGAALDSALRTGVFVCPSNFRRYKHSALPSFLKGLLRRIFALDGSLLENIDFSAITEVRQICFCFYKAKVAFSDAMISKAISKFKSVDESCYKTGSDLSEEAEQVLVLASEFIENLFKEFDPKDIVPAHGPGIVSSGEKPHEKRFFSTLYRNIHNEYPYYRYFYINSAHLAGDVASYGGRIRKEVGINKVLFVPKDSRGPRTIACEPLEYMWIQQGLRVSLYDHVENHVLTRGRINFTDQSINQRLAERASCVENDLVTLDLKDASDLVSVDLVKRLFSKTPLLLRCLLALRTDKSRLPNGEIVELNKYAAMGSALCFPVEAIVFYSLLVGINALLEKKSPPHYVYGDDIIIHKDMLPYTLDLFPQYKLVINESKSCTTGFFRESCGAEFYFGHDITYIKAREIEISSPEQVASAVSLSNDLFGRGYYRAAKYVEKAVKRFFPSIPFGYKGASFLCFYNERSPIAPFSKKVRWNYQLQRIEKLLPCLKGVTYQASMVTTSELYAEYLRKLTSGWSPHFVSGSYAKRKVKLKYRWVHSMV